MSLATLDPSAIKPLGTRILVRRYEKPESVKGIIIPEMYRPDATLSLWEVVRSSAASDELLGDELAPGDIIQTRPWRGTEAGDGTHYFVLAQDVLKVIRW